MQFLKHGYNTSIGCFNELPSVFGAWYSESRHVDKHLIFGLAEAAGIPLRNDQAIVGVLTQPYTGGSR